MADYRDEFKLDIKDIDLIESALREQASQIARDRDAADGEGEVGEPGDSRRAIQDLLGRLHRQKIFYSHTARKAVPNG